MLFPDYTSLKTAEVGVHFISYQSERFGDFHRALGRARKTFTSPGPGKDFVSSAATCGEKMADNVAEDLERLEKGMDNLAVTAGSGENNVRI